MDAPFTVSELLTAVDVGARVLAVVLAIVPAAVSLVVSACASTIVPECVERAATATCSTRGHRRDRAR